MSQNQSIPRFHLAFPVKELEQTLSFYCDLLGCKTVRSSDKWIDFDFLGHHDAAQINVDKSDKFFTDEL